MLKEEDLYRYISGVCRKNIKCKIRVNKLLFWVFFVIFLQPTIFVEAVSGNKNMYPNAMISSDKLDDFIGEAEKNLTKKYKVFTCGVGGGVRDKVWLIELNFQRYGSPLTEIEARKLIIAMTQNLLNLANTDKKLKPHMENYPFTSKNVSIAVFNYTEKGADYSHPYITIASVSEGMVLLMSFDSQNRYLKKIDIYEPYEESLEILKREYEGK